MDYSGSEWSSGCESGWTSYFDESNQLSPNQWQRGGGKMISSNRNGHENYCKVGKNYEEEEEEDLSMVSDASSGPSPHLQDYYHDDCFDPIRSGHDHLGILPMENSDIRKKMNKKKKKKNGSSCDYQQRGNQHQHQQHSYQLDDTATSPALNHSKMYVAPCFIHQASVDDPHQFQGNSVINNHFSFWQSSYPKKSDSAEPSN